MWGADQPAVSPLTLGTMNFGKETDAEVSLRVVDAYVEAGGNLLDTADCYGDGASERICALALARHRGRLMLATKTGRPVGDDDPGGYRPARLRAAVEGSLRRLGVDRLDLFQLHQWDPDTAIEDAVAVLADLQKQGTIGAYGFSNLPPWTLGEARAWAAATGRPLAAASQYHYSLTCRDIEDAILPFFQEYGMTLMAWSPLSGGLLTGKYRTEATDARRGDRPTGKRGYSYERARPVADRVVDALDRIAVPAGVSPAAVALRWVLDRPAVSTAIVGARTVAQLTENLAALTLTLTAPDRARLDALTAPGPRYPHDFLAQVLAPRR